MPKILVFIPMYNCEKQIPRVLGNFSQDVQSFFSEILVVDNGSKDNSLANAEEGLQKLVGIKTTLIQNNYNVSLGGSHKVAFGYAMEQGYDYVIILHGDDQGSILDMIPHLKSGEAFKHGAFLGSRFMKGSQTPSYSAFRIFGNYVFNFLISIALGRRLTDMGSGLNMLAVNPLKSQYYMPFANNLTFNVYLLFYLVWSKENLAFFPLTWREEDQVSNAKMFRQAFHILRMIGAYLVNPRRLFTENINGQSNYSYTIKYQSKK